MITDNLEQLQLPTHEYSCRRILCDSHRFEHQQFEATVDATSSRTSAELADASMSTSLSCRRSTREDEVICLVRSLC